MRKENYPELVWLEKFWNKENLQSLPPLLRTHLLKPSETYLKWIFERVWGKSVRYFLYRALKPGLFHVYYTIKFKQSPQYTQQFVQMFSNAFSSFPSFH